MNYYSHKLLDSLCGPCFMDKFLGPFAKKKKPWFERFCRLHIFKLLEPLFFEWARVPKFAQVKYLPQGKCGRIKFRRYESLIPGSDGKLPYTEEGIEA